MSGVVHTEIQMGRDGWGEGTEVREGGLGCDLRQILEILYLAIKILEIGIFVKNILESNSNVHLYCS